MLNKALTAVQDEYQQFIVIGLTGRTGSGCTTVAHMLQADEIAIPDESGFYENDNDKRKYLIVRDYIRGNWNPYICIQVKTIITSFILKRNFEEFVELVAAEMKSETTDTLSRLRTISSKYKAANARVNEFFDMGEKDKDAKINFAMELYFEYLPSFEVELKASLQSIDIDAYTKVYQKVGDNIRASGDAYVSEFDPDRLFELPKHINQLIKAIRRSRKNQKSHIVIDAIRNPFEAQYFQQRYANFFLFSVNTPNDERVKHLRKSHKFSDAAIERLDAKEYPKKLSGNDVFTSQNIQRCIELADVHINNPKRDEYDHADMASQVAWYVALIMHPGLVTPTAMERGMQLAYVAKLNSGCISRQVGAVVTDQHYSVKAVGWNNAPMGQVPCNLRTVKDLRTATGGDHEVKFSVYERTNQVFRRVFQESHTRETEKTANKLGLPYSYCFKDLQNEVDGEKNQVHTRSLHAEENAFLQITKYGGVSVNDGILFTTASPCELCSKKAYQLGIKKVIYVDPYPGISNQHILAIGSNKPSLTLFSGAIGQAYHKLYQPMLSYKDEIKMLIGYTISGGMKRDQKELKIRELEAKVKQLESALEEMKEGDDKK